jgi:hypothetical protein
MPAVLPLAAMLALYVGFGVPFGTSCLYLGYEALYILLPGWLVYRALAPRPGSRLRQLVLGWALGYVVEIAFFIFTGATGTRGQHFLYPLLVALVAVPVILRRGKEVGEPGEEEPKDAGRTGEWLLGGICALAVGYAGIALFNLLPYPGETAVYFPDYVYHLSLAAEAKHHWPVTEPAAAGEPKPYHIFSYLHLASATTITGIQEPVIVFRLYLLPQIALVAASIALLARSLTRRMWIAVAAVALALLSTELDFDSQSAVISQIPFFGVNFDDLILSPSFLLSEALLIPLALLAYELMRPRDGDGGLFRGRLGLWAIAALLAFGVSDAKVSALPVLLIALGVVGAWELARTRRLPRGVLAVAGLVGAVMLGLYLAVYAGADTPRDLELHPLLFIGKGMPVVLLFQDYFGGLVGGFVFKHALLDVGGAVFGFFGLLAPLLAGLYWLFRVQGRRLSLAQGWMLALFGPGLVLTDLFLGPASPNGTYFLNHAWPFGAVLAGEGLYLAWSNYGDDLRRAPRTSLGLALGFAALFTLLVGGPSWFDIFAGDSQIVVHTYLWWYGGLIVLLLALYAGGRLLLGAGKGAALLATGGVLAAAAVGIPLDYGLPALHNRTARAAAALAKPVTPDLYRGLRWISDNTPSGSVLAVNNHWVDFANKEPDWDAYSAFGERRVYLEGWYYTAKALEGGKNYFDVQTGKANPYADRLAISDAAFAGDCDALSTLAARGVDYLVVDRVNGTVQPPPGALDGVTRQVYSNPDIAVLQLLAGPLASPAQCRAAVASAGAP